MTEDRPAFIDWLLWCFDRQTWSNRELIIVDSSTETFHPETRKRVRSITVPLGTSVGKKRNRCLEEARGEIITWFDDDDWQHPSKLTWLVEALRDGSPYAGTSGGWFVDLMGLRCARYRASKAKIIFNSAGFLKEAVLPFRFREDLSRASDADWMRQLARHYPRKAVVLEREDMFFWLCHDMNLSNPATKRCFPKHLDVIRQQIGSEAWGDTDEALDALQACLRYGDRSANRASQRKDVERLEKRLIFVMGVQRSGTNALRRSLSSSPEVTGYNEAENNRFFLDWYLRPEPEIRRHLLEIPGTVLLKPIKETRRRETVAVMEEYTAYDLKVALIYRDPVNVYYSTQMRWPRRKNVDQFVELWNRQNQSVLNALEHHGDRILIVCYEDLVADHRLFEKLCGELGIKGKCLFGTDSGRGYANLRQQTCDRILKDTGDVWEWLQGSRCYAARKRQRDLSIPKIKSWCQHDHKNQKGDMRGQGELPPVGIMIKATVMDAPFLDIMVRHMISQARYPFAERVIIVDCPPAFSGKYRARPRASQMELEQTLERLQQDGTVDHVRKVDMAPTCVQQVMARYFIEDARRVPTHAATGGPNYATLFGLESMSTDYVLQMDADILFHTDTESWVQQALHCMESDPKLWLMMTHPGPPCGPPGHSLGAKNTQRATWDQDLQIWRFRNATTRYFLCDRRKLRHRLRMIRTARGCAPLEQCISGAFLRHGTYRGSLGNLQSWHLHVWYHGDPFPQWTNSLARIVEAGVYPDFQKGDYDLRLDRARDHREWKSLLDSWTNHSHALSSKMSFGDTANDHPHDQQGKRQPHRKSIAALIRQKSQDNPNRAATSKEQNIVTDSSRHLAPLAVIIPVRNRAGQRLRNALRSLNWQSSGCPAQVFVVSHGSRPEIDEDLSALCREEAATLLAIGSRADPWNKPLALNTGIRAVSQETPFVMTMDADMILAPGFVEVVLERLESKPPALVLCRISDLPEHAALPADRDQLLNAFDSLRAVARLRPCYGSGGIQAARRSFFYRIRGYDEDLLWWGGMDGDLVNRAKLADLSIEWVEHRTTMLHQWHPRKHSGLVRSQEMAEAKHAWRRNHLLVRSRSHILVRNLRGWGGVRESFQTMRQIPTGRAMTAAD